MSIHSEFVRSPESETGPPPLSIAPPSLHVPSDGDGDCAAACATSFEPRAVTGEEGLAAKIIADIQRVAHLLRGALTAHYAEFGLNDIRHDVLRMLRDSGANGCTQAQLARELKQSESSISTLVRRMRTDGLIYRLRPKDDQRKRQLLLTDRGSQMLSGVERCHADRMATLLSPFEPTQLERMADFLETLSEQLAALRRNRFAAKTSRESEASILLTEPAPAAQQQPAA